MVRRFHASYESSRVAPGENSPALQRRVHPKQNHPSPVEPALSEVEGDGT